MTLDIRHYRPTDRADLYDVCIRTANVGKDARDLYPDHELVGAIYAEPFVVLEPDLAFMLDNGSHVVGYIVGTADTPGFARRFAEEWLPTVADRFPAPTGEPSTPEEVMRSRLYRPERTVFPQLADYPAHMHIDLLPEYRGGGNGRRLMRAFLTAARTAGAEKAHMTPFNGNTSAWPFYERMGFRPMPLPDMGDYTCLVRSTDVEAPPKV
jgi:GNAT superfamily N-acetyltransferase